MIGENREQAEKSCEIVQIITINLRTAEKFICDIFEGFLFLDNILKFGLSCELIPYCGLMLQLPVIVCEHFSDEMCKDTLHSRRSFASVLVNM